LDYETQIPELGFIAEEVAEAAPDATLYDVNGDPIVYREKSMLSLLVKAVQDLNERVEALD
jgi:chaperonin cofactor prefoldin